jgi:hypothetical protein
MRGVEKEAFTWEREGIFSIEAAERYIKEREARHGEIELIKKALQIGGRELAPTERKYIESWTVLGFGAEEAAIAFDRTMTQTGRLAWGYMDSIMNSWHAKGLRTAAEINERDKRADKPSARGKAAGKSRSRTPPGSGELERMRELLSGIGGSGGAAEDGD